ncbi:MAG: hypothetical protein ACLFR8_09815 [Alkalispirochaeta sp.]
MPRITRARGPVLVVVLLLTWTHLVVAQSGAPPSPGPIRVHILPAVNRTGQAQFDAVATTVTGTVSLTLRLLGDYDISNTEPEGSAESRPLPTDTTERLEVLASLAETLDVENIVFGEVLPGDPVPEITLSVYDRLSGDITLRERRRPQSLFGIFGATDELAAALLSGFSGRRIAFGSIRIEPAVVTGGDAGDGGIADDPAPRVPDYRVILDGEELGTNLRTIDSILTGEHRLTVTADILGETETLLDRTVTVEEGATVALTLELPDIDLAGETAALEQRRAQERLDMALRKLEEMRLAVEQKTSFTRSWQREFDEIGVAEYYFLRAEEYLDPARVREAAVAVADTLAAARMVTGRAYLSRREYDEGVEIIRTVPELGARFDQNDLFGFRDEVGFVNYNWSEYEVQRERKPMPWLPVFVTGWALNWFLGGDDYQDGGVQSMAVPLVPALMTTGLVSLWNSNDWDIPQRRRAVRRYGRDFDPAAGDYPPPPWNLARWEVVVLAHSGHSTNVNRTIQDVAVTPDELGAEETYTVDTVDFGGGGFLSASVEIRYRLNLSNAVGFRYRSSVFEDSMRIEIDDVSCGDHEADVPAASAFQLGLSWYHTRTGRAFLETGVTYRSVTYREPEYDDFLDDRAEQIFIPELLGGSSAGVDVFGGVLGIGWRFGRLPRRPWEFLFQYQLDRYAFPAGELQKQGPYYGHSIHFNLGRSFGFGPAVAGETDYGGLAETDAARRAAESTWEASPLGIMADFGGLIGWGPRLGFEWNVTEGWALQLWARQHIAPDRLGIARTTTAVDNPVHDAVIFPGIGVRRYLDNRWYIGAQTELMAFDNLRNDIGDDGDDLTNDGITIVPQIEGGYRLPIWRSLSLDLGLQAGLTVPLDGGVESVITEDFGEPDAFVLQRDTIGVVPWYHLVIAVVTPIF